MVYLKNQLELNRCPYCGVDKPQLTQQSQAITSADYRGNNPRVWKTYMCQRCGGVVIAWSTSDDGMALGTLPTSTKIDESIPSRACEYLRQAMDSLHSPAGSVILSASAVDAMLKERDFKKGSLNSRIDQAQKAHLITEEMARWAHNVRLDANDQRHSDEDAPLPTTEDARRCLDFALALAEFLFVLPSRVKRGLGEQS